MSYGDKPAYPVIGAPGAPEDYPGLTKREAFAMAAMPMAWAAELADLRDANDDANDSHVSGAQVARRARVIADQMLAELEQQP